MDCERFTCSICYHFTASNMVAVLRHIGSIHAHQAGFKVVCGINGCPRSYINYGSFRKHLYRKHSETVEPVLGHSIHSVLDELAPCSPPAPTTLTDEDKLKRSLILFILKSKEIHQLSQLALNGILSDISLIYDHLIESFSSRVASTLTENGLNYKDVGLEEVLKDEQLRDVFRGYHTTYLQKKLFHSVGLVVSAISCS